MLFGIKFSHRQPCPSSSPTCVSSISLTSNPAPPRSLRLRENQTIPISASLLPPLCPPERETSYICLSRSHSALPRPFTFFSSTISALTLKTAMIIASLHKRNHRDRIKNVLDFSLLIDTVVLPTPLKIHRNTPAVPHPHMHILYSTTLSEARRLRTVDVRVL